MEKVEWYLTEYSKSHQHKTNILIHKICVPLIFFSLVGFVLVFERLLELNYLTLGIMSLVMMYYFNLSKRFFFYMIPVFFICYLLNLIIGLKSNLFIVSLTIFLTSWVFQFIGHKIEGKKPSFFEDIQFLLIGPLWTIQQFIHRR